MTLYKMLLLIHVLTGATALIAAILATLSKSLNLAHRWHVISGTVFFWTMMVIFLTAVPLSLIKPNAFLLLIATLSFYFAVAGWRYASNRQGSPRLIDWVSAGVMALAALIMLTFGIFLIRSGDANGVTMIVLGGIGGTLSIADLRASRLGGVKGPERIARHLTMMLAGAIATITAFVVTNVTIGSALIVWLAPTVLITPIIVLWARRIRRGAKPKGMPESS